MEYKVKFEDNLGSEDCTETYKTEQEAEDAITEDLNSVKSYFESKGSKARYADFGTKTEIWESGGDGYASWERLWK